jgi:hypothetical protein
MALNARLVTVADVGAKADVAVDQGPQSATQPATNSNSTTCLRSKKHTISASLADRRPLSLPRNADLPCR